jgi:hypothetical protein
VGENYYFLKFHDQDWHSPRNAKIGVAMNVPLSTDKIWKDILQGRVKFNFEFLALKIMLGRLFREMERDPSPAMLQKCADEIYNLLSKNAQLPTAKRDIQKILEA